MTLAASCFPWRSEMTDPQERPAGLLRRPWIRLLVAAWIIAILAIYFQLQIGRVLAMAGILPEH